MKKILILFMSAVLAYSSLCACSGDVETGGGSAETGDGNAETGGGDGAAGQGSGMQQGAGDGVSSGSGGLRLLSNRFGESACNTENGYYYLTSELEELRDGSLGTHLMYMDFATGREVYLCSTAGCKHDSPDCPAVFAGDDFPAVSSIPFVFGDYLYVLSREYDDDGSVSMETAAFGEDAGSVESQPAALYRMNLDGTGRKKVYTFDAALTLEDKVIGNDQGIYVVTKKLSTDKDGSQSYTTSSERRLMFLDLGTAELSEVCSMDFGDHISWQMIDCLPNGFLLSGIDFGREISRDEQWDDDVYKELYNSSSQVYAVLGCDGGKPREIARQSNEYSNSAKLLGNKLYLSSEENQDIDVLDIQTGKKKKLCSLPQNLIMDALGGMLCCREWDLAGDPTWYFVDAETGAVAKTPLVIPCNGWAIEFRCETKTDVLFVYDYDAAKSFDDSYEIHQYKHALISKEDLFAGKDSYRKIEMVGPGQ